MQRFQTISIFVLGEKCDKNKKDTRRTFFLTPYRAHCFFVLLFVLFCYVLLRNNCAGDYSIDNGTHCVAIARSVPRIGIYESIY